MKGIDYLQFKDEGLQTALEAWEKQLLPGDRLAVLSEARSLPAKSCFIRFERNQIGRSFPAYSLKFKPDTLRFNELTGMVTLVEQIKPAPTEKTEPKKRKRL